MHSLSASIEIISRLFHSNFDEIILGVRKFKTCIVVVVVVTWVFSNVTH